MVRAKRPFSRAVKKRAAAARLSWSDVEAGGAAEFGIKEGWLGYLAGGDVAADDFEGLIGEETGEGVGFAEFPVADEAVVAGIALEVDAEEDLSGVLRGLHGRSLGGVDGTAPGDALDETGGTTFFGGSEEVADELVVGLVLLRGR